jgi:hypothetical protein
LTAGTCPVQPTPLIRSFDQPVPRQHQPIPGGRENSTANRFWPRGHAKRDGELLTNDLVVLISRSASAPR